MGRKKRIVYIKCNPKYSYLVEREHINERLAYQYITPDGEKIVKGKTFLELFNHAKKAGLIPKRWAYKDRYRDSQRKAVYKWENRITYEIKTDGVLHDVQNPQITIFECRDIVNKIWNDYWPHKQPPPVLPGRKNAKCAKGGLTQITLPPWARNQMVTIHEVAHALLKMAPERYAAHGPEFCTLLTHLWAQYMNMPRYVTKYMGEEQRPRRVRFSNELVLKPLSLLLSLAAKPMSTEVPD